MNVDEGSDVLKKRRGSWTREVGMAVFVMVDVVPASSPYCGKEVGECLRTSAVKIGVVRSSSWLERSFAFGRRLSWYWSSSMAFSSSGVRGVAGLAKVLLVSLEELLLGVPPSSDEVLSELTSLDESSMAASFRFKWCSCLYLYCLEEGAHPWVFRNTSRAH